ncbi:S24 family peptidase [Glaciecola sp. 1036]|uniref:S24 family peptidase n=1 Tax=Alteromonadaceae TaxID=72275 RepID=UPI003CFE494E
MDKYEFGKYLEDLRLTGARLNRKQFHEKYGWHQNSIRGYELGERLCDVDYICCLAIASEANLIDLLLLRLEQGLIQFPLESAPDGRIKTINKAIEKLKHFSNKSPSKQDARINTWRDAESVILEDESMEPTIQKGSSVHHKALTSKIKDGHLYIVDINEYRTVRRVHVSPINREVIFKCDNPVFHNITFSDKEDYIQFIVGKVTSFSTFIT